jgi:PhnB protein
MQSVHPYLNFNGDAEEAFELYRTVFGGDFNGVMRFRDFGVNEMDVPEDQLDRIAHISLPIAEGVNLMGSDIVGGDAEMFTVGTNVYTYVEAGASEEAERVFKALSDGGQVEMPLSKTDWAEKYGTCVDRFGVRWMVSHTGDVQFQL